MDSNAATVLAAFQDMDADLCCGRASAGWSWARSDVELVPETGAGEVRVAPELFDPIKLGNGV